MDAETKASCATDVRTPAAPVTAEGEVAMSRQALVRKAWRKTRPAGFSLFSVRRVTMHDAIYQILQKAVKDRKLNSQPLVCKTSAVTTDLQTGY
ncbi:hypothetical protein M514_12179 [Trichuris suis]|uniref:Uncharacterized protein n=1 Tax=Trichuris suis TaxID=68888 RepID=A0A085LPN7_9BILA|nr:hypothetical protein M513_12179 [Trichuris suis]KFD62227.1 hypothetical protein M514_12179 [Trichuris suis]